ncbi:hypothetical protein ABZ369_22375 [Streptomyces sp. NPDC005918]|uniref:hypothetical protein n=1 Tax=Streptomyces sp. NPDC005918 TaxID=3155454 RepID=UPI0033E36675
MTETPYTDDDLRTEAARQHRLSLTQFNPRDVLLRMLDAPVESTRSDDDALTWDEALDCDQFDEPKTAITGLIQGAADTSEWAIALGADGLVPSTDHALGVDFDGRPAARVLFAYAPDVPEEVRIALRQAIGEAITDRETDEERADREKTERDHARGDHAHCGLNCEVELPTEQLRTFVVAKGYPGTKGALDELLRRARAEATTTSAATEFELRGTVEIRRTAYRDAADIAMNEASRLYDDLGQKAAAGAQAVADRLRRMADEAQPATEE